MVKSTKNIKVPEKIVDQVIGQDEAVRVIKKAAQQRRHVFLIGDPGTGKSMLGLALAELLPKSDLKDLLSYPNPNDENNPTIKVLPAGKGREEVNKFNLDAKQAFKNNNFIFFILLIAVIATPWFAWSYYSKFGTIEAAIITAASLVVGMLVLVVFSIAMNMGPKLFKTQKTIAPKVIVDNFEKKEAPFFDATGTHAGALLGDVLHDPFQTFFTGQDLQITDGNKIENKKINEQIDALMNKHSNKILQKKEKNYEAIFLPKNELYVIGETNGSVSPIEVLSSNRYDHNGEMIKLATSENKELIVTPEHKIAVWNSEKIAYVEAQKIKEGDEIVAKSKDIIINEQDIINTYDKRQREQCRLFYEYKKIKQKNPSWGYKRISKVMNQPEAKTRWWNAGKHIPYPVQTVNWLKKRKLLPLKINDSKLPLIAKVLGATFGDGGIFENINGIFLSSSEKEAVQEFGTDIENIFGLKENTNSRIIEGGEYGHSWCYQNTNRNIIRFFVALGCPTGKKTEQDLIFPGWIKLKDCFEKEFCGSLIGSELGTPIIHKRGNYLTSLELGITSTPEFKENRLILLGELNNYLKKNRVNTTSIYQGKSKTEGNLVYRLLIEKKIDNVILFLMNVKINYCEYKVERLYKALGEWTNLKINKYNELTKKGYGAEHAMKVLNLTPNSLYLVLNHFGQNKEEIIT